MNAENSKFETAAHQSHKHESAEKHVSGKAIYVDDIPEPPGLLHVQPGLSKIAHGKISKLDLEDVRNSAGVVAVLTAQDVPGINDASPIAGDDPIFADELVEYAGQCIFAVVANSRHAAIEAVRKATIEIDPLPPTLTVSDALAENLEISPTCYFEQGNYKKALNEANNRLSGSFAVGGQDHFYLEGQVAMALPQEDDDMLVYSSTQNPTEVQNLLAKTLDVPDNAVTVEIRRMGGGFGGKETSPAQIAAITAIAARKTGHPAKLRLDRDDDMIMTGKRHDFLIEYDVGFDGEGRIDGLDLMLASRCGRSLDLSAAINDRAMFHSDNCYYLENVRITSRRLKTHTVSNTAFRGFGGPQGMLAIENVMDAIAQKLGKEPLDIRRANLYGKDDRNITPYGMTVEDNIAPEIISELARSSDYLRRKDEIAEWNKSNANCKRGIALTPVKFGISFTATQYNQAGALVHVYKDGSIHLNHGGTEMGQGLFTKVAQIVAHEFQLPLERVKITATTTAKVPNTSATAASSGTDLNGMAARNAANQIKDRLIAFASERFQCGKSDIFFIDGNVVAPNQTIAFEDLVAEAYLARIQLSAAGFYKTPKIYWDKAKSKGRPFYYFAYGAAVSEVAIDVYTGEHKVLRSDILHDCGKSLNPALDLGQIEGAFIQGLGWLTCEELVFDDKGVLRTHAPSTYKIPTASDRPDIFNMKLWEGSENIEPTIYRSKAVGEPPFMLAISVFSALSHAIGSVSNHSIAVKLDAPATPERIFMSVQAQLENQGVAS